jgi:phage tail sheath protein FI
MTGPGARALVLTVIVAMLAIATNVRAEAVSTPQASLPNDIVPATSGEPLFIGSGAAPGAGVVPINGLNDFTEEISAPSPRLLAAVQAFYDNGGGAAYVLTIATEDAQGFSAALAAVTPGAPARTGWDLLVIPAIGALTPADWLTTASQMTAIASAHQATAILDPPDATVAAAQSGGPAPLTALAQQLSGAVSSPANAVLLSSGLTDDEGNPVPGAGVMAGLITMSDTTTGVWGAPGGPDHVVPGLQPVLLVNDALDSAFGAAGIDSWRVLPGSGTIVLSSFTLVGGNFRERSEEWISEQRTASWISRSIDPALEAYAFAPNNASTWSAVSESISNFLTSLWGAGGLGGPTAAASFTVSVGFPATMTAQDVLDGLMIVSVDVDLVQYRAPVTLTFQQQTS